MSGLAEIMSILFLILVFYALGFRVVRRQSTEAEPDESQFSGEETESLDRRAMLLRSISEPPFTEVLSEDQRRQLRQAILHPEQNVAAPIPEQEYVFPTRPETVSEPLFDSEPEVTPQTVSAPDPDSAPEFDYSSLYESHRADQSTAVEPDGVASNIYHPVAEQTDEESVAAPPARPRKPVAETIRASWDPAVMMLYVGALLVVVAGLIFASYNWGNLGGWQKMGLLAAGTSAFLIAGFAIRNIERVQPASTTFIVIGGLLVPANFLAAYTLFEDVQPALPLLLGAIATTVIHALLSYQPGASLFRYSSVGAAIIAIATVPAAFGFPAGWGGVFGLVVIALLPDEVFGAIRFRKPWMLVSRSAAGLLFGFAVWQGLGEHGWMVAGALISVSMVATRIAVRHPRVGGELLVFADLALIAASVQIAHNFDGDRWLIASGILALTLVLIRESWRFPTQVRGLEFAAAITSALLTAEIVRVLGSETWALATGAASLAVLMMVHARRHESLAPVSEAIAAFALPVSVGTAAYAINPSLWNLVFGLVALTGTMIWLGLRRAYPENWPGFVATIASLGTIITTVPAIGPDVGWGAVAAILVIAIAPYPFGRLEAFHRHWRQLANPIALILAPIALLRGAEVWDWLVVLTMLALSMWLTRMALEELPEPNALLAGSDLFAILTGVSFAFVLREDQWMLAAGLLGISLALFNRSFTWPRYQSALQFAAGIFFALFVGSVTQELSEPGWAVMAAALTLTTGMLVHARVHPRNAWSSEYVAVWSFPLAVGAGVATYHDSDWWLPIGGIVLTATLIWHSVRYRNSGDINLAISSVTGIASIVSVAELLGFMDGYQDSSVVLLSLGILLTVLANAVLPRFSSVSGWLKNLLRVEALPIFYVAWMLADGERALVVSVVLLAMLWNIWSSRVSEWSVPLAIALWVAVIDIVAPQDASLDAGLWWFLALAAIYAAIAWQLDRRTRDSESQLSGGVYLWIMVTLASVVLVFATVFEGMENEASIHFGITLIGAASLHWLGHRSTGSRFILLPAGFLGLLGLIAFTFDGVTDRQHLILAAVAFAIAAAMYWWTSAIRIWIALVVLAFGQAYLQLATDFSYTRDLTIGLVIAWILVSLAIAKWRSAESREVSNLIFGQALLLHGIAMILPLLNRADVTFDKSDLVLVLVSIAGLVATYGSLQRNRAIVLLGSSFGMSALMLQVNIGSPGNLHVYTVPLSIYLIAVGLLLRRDARVANTLLAAGSAMLVVPAMIEALTTGDIVWLWVALAEALGLFLFGTLLRLRIPTAAGVIAVSVILLRMLVFAVSVLASWVSILAIGVSLLLIGTMWLLFREAIQAKARAVFGRWQAFD